MCHDKVRASTNIACSCPYISTVLTAYCCTLVCIQILLSISLSVNCATPAIGCFTFLLRMFKLDQIWSDSATSRRRSPAYSNNSGDCAELHSLHPPHSNRRYCSSVLVWYSVVLCTLTIPSHDAIHLYGNLCTMGYPSATCPY